MVDGYEWIYRMVAAERLPRQRALAPMLTPPTLEPVVGSVGAVSAAGSGFPERLDGAFGGGLVGS
jgi:hypothetical protein